MATTLNIPARSEEVLGVSFDFAPQMVAADATIDSVTTTGVENLRGQGTLEVTNGVINEKKVNVTVTVPTDAAGKSWRFWLRATTSEGNTLEQGAVVVVN